MVIAEPSAKGGAFKVWGSLQLFRSHASEAGLAPAGRLHWTDLKLLSNSNHLKKTIFQNGVRRGGKKKANILQQLSKLL